MKKIANFLFSKLFVLTIVAISISAMELFFHSLFKSEYSGRQLLLVVNLSITSLIALLFCAKFVTDKGWRISNYILGLFLMVLAIGIGQDYKNRPDQYELLPIGYSTTVTNSGKVILEAGKNDVFYTYKYKVIYDRFHPLKLYRHYKIDLFGDKSAPQTLHVKSDLMPNYVEILNFNSSQ